jgi:SOS regulatory protein LexA
MKENNPIQSVRKFMMSLFQNNRPVKDIIEIPSPYANPPSITTISILGSIQAGWPSPEEEALCDIMSMDEYLITNRDASFLLKVIGDSMIGEGIMEGDLVIIERGRKPVIGDVVIAEVDGEWTIKYFKKQNGQVFLEAANPKYSIIYPKMELRLGGVVVAVVRKYH